MKTQFLIFALFLSLTATAQQMPAQFNTPFVDVAKLSRDDDFRSRVGVAMYIRAGEALIDTTTKEANYAYYEKLFASLIVTEGDNRYYVSLFTNAVLTTGANAATPDAYLYGGVSALWRNIVEAWMYRNGYVKLAVEPAEPVELTTEGK
jgi:hypothetical protein